MTPKEKALELYDKFQQYLWDEVDGFMPDNKETKKTVHKVIDEIESALTEYGAMSGELQNMDSDWRFWQSVKEQLNNL